MAVESAFLSKIDLTTLPDKLEEYKDQIPWADLHKRLGVETTLVQLIAFLQEKGIEVPYDRLKLLATENQENVKGFFKKILSKIAPKFLESWQSPGIWGKVRALGYLVLYGLVLAGLVAFYIWISGGSVS